MAKPTKIIVILILLSLPVTGMCDPHYAKGDYHGDLIQLGVRYLSSRLSRFTTPDPAKQFFSGYQYGAGVPVTLADPSGAVLPRLEGSIERSIAELENGGVVATENTQRLRARNRVQNEVPNRVIRRPAPTPSAPYRRRHLLSNTTPALQDALYELNSTELRIDETEHQIYATTQQLNRTAPGIRGAPTRLRLSMKLRELRHQRTQMNHKRGYYALRVQEEHARYVHAFRRWQLRTHVRTHAQPLGRNPRSGRWELQPGRVPVMESLDANLLFDQLHEIPTQAPQSLEERQRMARVREWLETTPLKKP